MSDSFFVTTPFKDIMKKNDEKCAKKVVHINIAAGCKESLAFGPKYPPPSLL